MTTVLDVALMSCVVLVSWTPGVCGVSSQLDELGVGGVSVLLTAASVFLLIMVLGLCLLFKRRSFDIVQPDIGLESTAAFYQYRSHLQTQLYYSTTPDPHRSAEAHPPVGPRVSVVSLIPPDEETPAFRKQSSQLSAIKEEPCLPNGTASNMVDVNGGFAVLAVPASEPHTYTDDDYTTVDKVKRTGVGSVSTVTRDYTQYRDSVLSLEENKPAVPPKTPESMQFV